MNSKKYELLILTISFLIFLETPLVSQKYGSAWIVGYSNDSTFYPKYGKTEINFSNGSLALNYKFGEKKPFLGFTNASIANEDGTLKYFTDGYRIYDHNQKVIQNGDSINYGRIWKDYAYGGYPTGFNHYFIPMPGKEDSQTVLLHFELNYHPEFIIRYVYTPVFKFSLINYESNSKKSKVVIKDSIVSEGDFVETHMSVTKHANGRDWWIIIEDYLTNNHRIYLLDTSGVRLHSTQRIGSVADSFDWTGNSMFTPNGEMFIKYLRGYQLQLFDFDRCYGILSNPKVVINNKAKFKDVCYLAVSPNNRFLYLNSDSTIWQYDLIASNIQNSETIIGEWDGYFFEDRLSTKFNQISLAPDGKIYVTCRSSSIYLHAINNPNEKGINCNFKLRQVELPAFMFGNLPTPPNYNLYTKVNSICDTLLNNTIQTPIAEEILFIYPNPTSNSFRIETKSHSKLTVRIFSLIGNFVKEFIGDSTSIYNVSDIPKGIYFINIQTKDEELTKKIVIN